MSAGAARSAPAGPFSPTRPSASTLTMVCFLTALLRSHPAHACDYAEWRVPAWVEATSTFAAYGRIPGVAPEYARARRTVLRAPNSTRRQGARAVARG
jgi:hypothetical protein